MTGHKTDVAGIVSIGAGGAAWMPLLGEVVQAMAGLIGIVSGCVYLYTWWKEHKGK